MSKQQCLQAIYGLVLISLACVQPAASAEVVEVQQGLQSQELGLHWQYFEDPRGQMSIDQVSRASNNLNFTRSVVERPNFGITSSAYWFRMQLLLPDRRNWILEVAHSQLDSVILFTKRSSEEWEMRQTGDILPLSSRDIPSSTFLFRLPAGQVPLNVYLRISSQTVVALPANVWREDAYWQHNQRSQSLEGLYLGFLVALALYNLFLYLAVRDRAYVYYVGYLATIALFQYSRKGLAALYLWPNFPQWGHIAPYVFLILCLYFGLRFIRSMVPVNIGMLNLIRMLEWTSLGLLAMLAVLDVGVVFRPMLLLCLVVLSVTTVVVVNAWRQGYRPARYLIFAFSALAPGAILMILRTLDVIPVSDLTETTLQIGISLEALLLSFALADRINLLKYEKDLVQERLLVSEQISLNVQRDFSQRLISAQDSERKRIASDLHDGLGQSLTLMANRLRRLRANVEDSAAAQELDGLDSQAHEVITEVRNVSHDLHPHQLDILGLSAALEANVQRTLGATDIDYECAVDGMDARLPKKVELQLYRITQEALNNIVRHADAQNVSVALRTDPESVSLRISDDGCGMNEPGKSTGLGLASIAERVRNMKGRLQIDSSLGEGLALTVNIPLPAAANV